MERAPPSFFIHKTQSKAKMKIRDEKYLLKYHNGVTNTYLTSYLGEKILVMYLFIMFGSSGFTRLLIFLISRSDNYYLMISKRF
jgi:hypothetical protein